MKLLGALSRGPRLGWKPNPADSRDVPFDRLSVAQASSDSRELFVPEILDQGPSSACVGFGLALAVGVVEVDAGLPYELASPWFPYWHSRLQHYSENVDGGTFIRTGANACRYEGMPANRYWKRGVLGWNVNRQPGRNAYRFAHGRRGMSYYHLAQYTEEKLVQIRAAIDAGLPVVFGSTLRESFLDWNGNDLIDVPKSSEKIAGGHCMVMVGYSDRGVKIANSWGTRWRDNGFAWLTWSYVLGYCRDETVVTGWNALIVATKNRGTA